LFIYILKLLCHDNYLDEFDTRKLFNSALILCTVIVNRELSLRSNERKRTQ